MRQSGACGIPYRWYLASLPICCVVQLVPWRVGLGASSQKDGAAGLGESFHLLTPRLSCQGDGNILWSTRGMWGMLRIRWMSPIFCCHCSSLTLTFQRTAFPSDGAGSRVCPGAGTAGMRGLRSSSQNRGTPPRPLEIPGAVT